MKNYFKKFAFLIIYLLGKIFPRSGIPVLFFHSLDNSGSVLSILGSNFTKHMIYLKKSGYQSLTMDEFAENFKSQSFPKKKFSITFDDGYKNNAEAVNILKELGFSAVVFITTEYMGRNNSFCEQKVPVLSMLSIKEIKSLEKTGFVEFGAHGHTHRNLTDLSREEASSDIRESKRILEKELGHGITSFCYPRGKFNREIAEELKLQGFSFAFTSETGIVSKNSLKYFLPRVPINDKVSDSQFKALLSPWYGFFKNLL